MTTVEHYFSQQRYQIMKYQYENGSLYIQKREEEPYGMKERITPWNELVWPQTDNNWAPSLGDCEVVATNEEVGEESDIEFEYLSDVESEYSD